MKKEVTIASFQAKGIRLQIVVKNNNTLIIKNRKVQRIDYPYREKWQANDKIYHSFLDVIKNYILNEIIWRIKEDKTFTGIEDFVSAKGIADESIQGTYKAQKKLC